jgi:putative ABC transport system substrate-binding protein
MLRAVADGARAFDLQVSYIDLLGPEPAQLEQAFSLVLPKRPDALLVVPAPPIGALLPRIAELAIANRLPSIGADIYFPRSGVLLSYGASYSDLSRRAATYIDKILKGAKPADLPVEKPIKFDFGINLKTAQALGLTIPQGVLVQATEVIQ